MLKLLDDLTDEEIAAKLPVQLRHRGLSRGAFPCKAPMADCASMSSRHGATSCGPRKKDARSTGRVERDRLGAIGSGPTRYP